MVMVGRRRELAVVDRLLERAVAGAGGLLVVTGAPGSGTTTVLDAAAESARHRGLLVVRGTGTPESDDPTGAGPTLLLIDDADRAVPAELLNRLADRAGSEPTAIVMAARKPLGLSPELHLSGLSEVELAVLFEGLPTAAVHAVWLASGGLPGPAIDFVEQIDDVNAGTAEVFVRLSLTAPSRTGFLELDAGLIRLLEATVDLDLPTRDRATVLARLARELLGDPSAGPRRRHLIDEAVALARADGDPGTIAAVLDHRLHALWDPAAAHERLSTASEIVRFARQAADGELERRGLFWSFVAHAELGDLSTAESALMLYRQAAELAGDQAAGIVVLARQAMLALVRGRFETADSLVTEVAEQGGQAGMIDTDRLVASIRGQSALLRGELAGHPEGELAGYPEQVQALARQMPGHFYEATAARLLLETGREVEAALELQRLRPAVLAGTGPRWLGAVADLAVVAALTGTPDDALTLYDALIPYRGRLVVWGGANTITGPVDDCLGRLAVRLGRFDDAAVHLNDAITLEERIGALPWLVHTLLVRARTQDATTGAAEQDRDRARTIGRQLGMTLTSTPADPSEPREWQLIRDGDDWRLDTGSETARFRDRRGIHYLRLLLTSPGQEIPALDVIAGGAGPPSQDEMPVLDAEARTAYRRRLSELEHQLEDADRRGDVERATTADAERTALVTELRRATGLGGRPRMVAGEAERARVNATRALWTTVGLIEAAAPRAGAHLRASLRTGRLLRYQPAPGGPARWRL